MGFLMRRLPVGAAVALIVLIPWHAGLFHRLNLIAVDAGFAVRPLAPPPGDVVVVGITSRCQDALGEFPLPRRMHARAIEILRRAGASVIAFDMYFDKASADPADDEALGAAARQAGNVYFAVFGTRKGDLIRITRSVPLLTGAPVREAHINVNRDADGKVRSAPCQIHNLREWFLFAPIALAIHRDDVELRLHGGRGGAEAPSRRGRRPEQMELVAGGRRLLLRTDGPRGNSLILDLGHTDLTRGFLPYRALLAGEFPEGMFDGKIVLVGWVAKGTPFADELDTTRGRKFGVFALAETTQQIIDGRFIRPVGRAAAALMILAFALATPLLFSGRRVLLSLFVFVLVLAVVWASFLALMAGRGIILEPAPVTAVTLLSLVVTTALTLRRTRHELIRDAKAMALLQQLGETVAETTGMAAVLSGHRPDVSDSFVLPAQTPRVLLQSIGQAVGAQRGSLYLWREDSAGLACVASFGEAQERVPSGLVRRINARLAEERAPFAGDSLERGMGFSSAEVPHTILAMPLSTQDRILGAVHLYDKRSTEVSPGRQFTAADLRLVALMVQQTLIGVENAMLYEGMRDIFLRATLALANAVDAKDPYTRGHSERVVQYSEQVARAMGLTERDVEITRMSAVLHDIGKIAIPDDILRKPGRLTGPEYEVIKSHPARGEAIVMPMAELGPLLAGIRRHHERYGGGGYPDGIAGEEIPLYARVICVADAYDAMTSARLYRPARSRKEALEEVRRCSGEQFDPEMASCLVGALGG